MSYAVRWKRAAEDQLALIWAMTSDPDTVIDAAEDLERLLASRPNDVGESRAGNRRVGYVGQLGASFAVYEKTKRVVVLAVWRVT